MDNSSVQSNRGAWLSRANRKRKKTRRRTYRPQLECLESRLLLSASVTFTSKFTTLGGAPLADPDGDHVPEVPVGTDILYQVWVQDTRQPTTGDPNPRMGVFEAYVNIPINFSIVSTAYQEEQSLTINCNASCSIRLASTF